jgi:hypothetical protein
VEGGFTPADPKAPDYLSEEKLNENRSGKLDQAAPARLFFCALLPDHVHCTLFIYLPESSQAFAALDAGLVYRDF